MLYQMNDDLNLIEMLIVVVITIIITLLLVTLGYGVGYSNTRVIKEEIPCVIPGDVRLL